MVKVIAEGPIHSGEYLRYTLEQYERDGTMQYCLTLYDVTDSTREFIDSNKSRLMNILKRYAGDVR